MTMACAGWHNRAANNIYDYLNYFENDTKEMKERKKFQAIAGKQKQ